MTCFPSMTWEYIDGEMTIPRYNVMVAYWRKHPPLHMVVAAFVGVKTEPSAPSIEAQEEPPEYEE